MSMHNDPDYNRQVGQRYSPQYDPTVGAPVAVAAPEVRAAFLQKVYLTLFAGLAVAMFTAFYCLSSVVSGEGEWLRTIYGSRYGFWGVFIAYIVMAMAAGAMARRPVVNILTYVLFTAVTGVLLFPLFAQAYIVAGKSYQIIWNAFAITGLVFGGLTAYVFISGRDFSFLRGFLTIGIFVLLGFIVATFFFQAEVFVTAVTIAGIVFFALFVLYDTSQIMNRLGPDEWVAGALSLFVDFINLFIRILSLMSRRR